MMKYFGLGIILSVLVFAMTYENEQELVLSEAMGQELLETLTSTIEAENIRFEEHYRTLKELFSSTAKYKYLPLLTGINEVKFKREAFNQCIQEFDIKINNNNKLSYQEKLTILSQLDTIINAQNDDILQLYEKIIRKDFNTFGGRDVELEPYLAKFNEKFLQISLKYKPIFTKELEDDTCFKLKYLMTQHWALQVQKYFEYAFAELAGGRILSCFEMTIPIVISDIKRINVGDYFETRIGIGSYSADYDPNTTKVIINGDTLKFDEQTGVMNYKIKAKTRGEHTLKMHCLILDPLTGQYFRGDSEYIYTVN